MDSKPSEKGGVLSEFEAKPVTLLEETIEKAEESYEKKNGEECIDLWTKAAALARICYGSRHYHYALSHVKAAQCYIEIHGLYDQALYHSREGLHAIDALPPDHKNSPKTIHTQANALCITGQIQIHQGLLIEAEENLLQAERASGQYSRTPGGEPDTLLDAKIAINLGRLCCKQKKFQLAKKCIEKGLELFRTTAVKDPSIELKLLHDLADVNTQLQDYEGAISCLNEADEFSKERFGPSSEETAEVLMKKAAVHVTILKRGVNCSEENVTQAENLLWDAYGILSIGKGSGYPRALAAQDEIVKLYILTERHTEAIKVLRDLIPSKIKTYGEGSMEVARAGKVLGSLYLYLGEVMKASQEMKKVREVFVAVLGPNHKESLEVSRSLDALAGSVDGRKVKSLQPCFKTTTKD